MKFDFRPDLAVAVAIALAILISLGAWQLKRLEWKRGLIADMTERLASPPIPFDEAMARAEAGEKMEYQPVFLDGVYADDLQSDIFGTYEGAPGVYVFTPLDVADQKGGRRFIYVNRGFTPQASRASESRAEGDVRVEGLFRRAERKRAFEKWLAPKDQPEDNLYFIRDPQILAARHAMSVPPFYVDSSGKENAGPWPKGGLTRIDIPNRHFEYALTWFGLAAALIGVYLSYSVKRDGDTGGA